MKTTRKRNRGKLGIEPLLTGMAGLARGLQTYHRIRLTFTSCWQSTPARITGGSGSLGCSDCQSSYRLFCYPSRWRNCTRQKQLFLARSCDERRHALKSSIWVRCPDGGFWRREVPFTRTMTGVCPNRASWFVLFMATRRAAHPVGRDSSRRACLVAKFGNGYRVYMVGLAGCCHGCLGLIFALVLPNPGDLSDGCFR